MAAPPPLKELIERLPPILAPRVKNQRTSRDKRRDRQQFVSAAI